jgi:hypothetical protein
MPSAAEALATLPLPAPRDEPPPAPVDASLSALDMARRNLARLAAAEARGELVDVAEVKAWATVASMFDVAPPPTEEYEADLSALTNAEQDQLLDLSLKVKFTRKVS